MNATKNWTKLVEQVKAARRVSVPLVAIDTPDQGATIEQIGKALNGDAPKLAWDLVGGMRPLNEAGEVAMRGIDADSTVMNAVGAMVAAGGLPEGAVLFMQNAHRFLEDVAVMQAVWNLRDRFKADRRMLVMLGPIVKLPPELAGDVVALSEPYPTQDEIGGIVTEVHRMAGLEPNAEVLPKAVAACTGLPAFAVEQLAAMSLKPTGIDLAEVRERVYRQIEQTPGLSVYRGKETFADVGGVEYAKTRLRRICGGRYAPQAIVRIDEIDKQLAGEGDLSGVSQDQLGALLTYMEDNKVKGILCVGPPGCTKSLITNAVGNEFDIPTLNFDMGAMKGSLVGQSEIQVRGSLKIVHSVSNGRPIFIATANSTEKLNTALLRRFPTVFYFDLPDKGEREKIWPVHMKRLGLEGDVPDDRNWAGADIRNCCEMAWEEDVSLIEAAQGIVPVGVRSAAEIERLRKQANGTYLSASYPGEYRMPTQQTGRRSVEV